MLDVSCNVVLLRLGKSARFSNPSIVFGLDELDHAVVMAAACPNPPDVPPVRFDIRWLPESREERAAKAVDFLCDNILGRSFKGSAATLMSSLQGDLLPFMDSGDGHVVALERRGEVAAMLGERAPALMALGWGNLASYNLTAMPGMMLATAARWAAVVPEAAPRGPQGR